MSHTALLHIRKRIRRAFAGLLLISWMGLGISACVGGERGLPAQNGIINFGQVNEHLYRGAQPDAAALENLKKLGVKTVINLRMSNDIWKDEEAQARCNGILCTNVPLRGMGRPTDEQINLVLSLINNSAGPVFIHCQHGCDRTGTIVACYRIKHDNWSVEQALAEAKRYGMSRFELGMKRYVTSFSKRNQTELASAKARPETGERRAEVAAPSVATR